VSGNFISPNQVSLSFQSPGRIKEVLVKEGDKVKQGDVLADIDTSALDAQVAQAQAGVELAQTRLAQSQEGGTAEQMAAAHALVAAALSNYNRVAKGPLPDDVAGAKANLDRAQALLNQAQAAYDKAGGASNPIAGLLPTSVNLQQATFGYEAALAQYNLAINHPTTAELAAAAVQVAQAKAAAAQLVPTQSNIDIAKAGVAQAQAALDAAKQGYTNTKITAPIDGTLLVVNAKVGESANPGSSEFVLADLSKMQVVANVDELTLSGLKVGQTATLLVDALGGKSLDAHISKVGLLATSSNGVVSVPVTLDVDTKDAGVYPGLSANVQFQAAP